MVCGKVGSFFKGGMRNTKFRLEGPTRVFKELGNFLFLKLGEKYLDAPFMYFYSLNCTFTLSTLLVCVFDISKTFLKKAYIHMVFFKCNRKVYKDPQSVSRLILPVSLTRGNH